MSLRQLLIFIISVAVIKVNIKFWLIQQGYKAEEEEYKKLSDKN